jgi:hypothetical protein
MLKNVLRKGFWKYKKRDFWKPKKQIVEQVKFANDFKSRFEDALFDEDDQIPEIKQYPKN